MSLHDSFLKLKFDKRMKTWNLSQGLVTEKEVKENLEGLPDVSENAKPMVLFPNPSDPTNTNQQPSQDPQTQQEEVANEKNDTTYNTQPPTITDQADPQEAQVVIEENVANKEENIGNKEENVPNKEENVTQKSNEDPSNPWW